MHGKRPRPDAFQRNFYLRFTGLAAFGDQKGVGLFENFGDALIGQTAHLILARINSLKTVLMIALENI
jgi:hypothetical protein